MTFIGLSGLVNFVSSICLGFFVISQNRKSPTNRSYFYLNSSVAFFSIGYFFWQLAATPALALFNFKILTVGIILINVTYLHFVFNFLGIFHKRKAILVICYGVNIGFIALNIFSYLYSDLVPKHGFGYWPVATPLFNLYLAFWLAQCLYGFLLLVRHLKKTTDPLKRNQIKYFLVAAIVGFCGGATNWPLWYNIPIPPYLNGLITIYIGLVAFAIIKHQLMDIEVVIRRTAVFAGLFAFVYGTFTVITVLGQDLFRNVFGWNQWIAMIPTVVVITFALRPLENYLTEITEKFLFQKKYDYRDLLKTFTNEVLTVLELQKLTEQTILELNKIIKLESVSILLLDKDTKTYRLASNHGVKDKAVTFSEEDAIISYLKQTHQPILKNEDADRMQGHSSLRDDFKKLSAQLSLPIAHHDELIGVLSLGMKKSGEEFTQEDVDILETLARTLGIAIANAQLFDQLSKTQAEAAQREKMAVIGTLAAGINHEICNPLGIVRGQCEMFLLNLRDGLYVQKSKDDMTAIASEIMNKVIKETDRATAITKKLSGFAKPAKKAESEEVHVEKEADEVMALLGHDLKLNNIDFKKSFATNFPPIYADKRQIQEVLFNIIRNAAQAMERDRKDGFIALSGIIERGAAVIKIADNGSGIPPDKIGQIFNPFFTTKEPGKGTGLGLFIVKQVIERNKGTINVESQEGVGTTFTLTFPIAEPAKVLAA